MLNPRQRKFCEHYSNGDGPAMAYQKAFKKTDPNVCAAAASRLLKRDEIQAELKRREEILEKVVTQKAGRKAQKEVGEIMTKLERIAAINELNKMDGSYTTNINHTVSGNNLPSWLNP